jgi:formyltetrahydrofolate deformylase
LRQGKETVSSAPASEFLLTIICPDQPGIVAAVTGVLFEQGCNIEDSAQFDDRSTGLFFMRIRFSHTQPMERAEIEAALTPTIARFEMKVRLVDTKYRPRLLLMVSKFGHCLNDLLHRWSSGALKVEIPAVVSNHRDFYQLAAWHDIPFHHMPVTADTKLGQEKKLRDLVEAERIDLIVLARYMQVLSTDMCREYAGRIINIHHSFLPSFKGAKPYHQAHARGVKLIGATAHYVTQDLDEGPIIEQEVQRVDHNATPEELVDLGRDVESVVLARAVRWHVENRVLLNGNKTVVFR